MRDRDFCAASLVRIAVVRWSLADAAALQGAVGHRGSALGRRLPVVGDAAAMDDSAVVGAAGGPVGQGLLQYLNYGGKVTAEFNHGGRLRIPLIVDYPRIADGLWLHSGDDSIEPMPGDDAAHWRTEDGVSCSSFVIGVLELDVPAAAIDGALKASGRPG